MPEQVARLRIELRRTKPKIWRRVDVLLSFSLMTLHEVIQAAFGWTGGHLIEFNVAGRLFSGPTRGECFSYDGWEPEDARTIRLQAIVYAGVRKFDYTYDLGDDWRHLIAVLRILDADPRIDYPALVAGARRAPPGNIGGVREFYNFLEAARDPDHPDRERFEERPGKHVMKSFDPNDFNAEITRKAVAFVGKNRHRPGIVSS